jgi:integrase-like protein
LNDIDKAKIAYEKALGSLERLSPEMARAFPSPDQVAAQSSAGATVTHITTQFTPGKVTKAAPASGSKDGHVAGKRGDGWVYRPWWRDKKTGQNKEAPVWWIAYSVRGKLIRQSSHSIKESAARRMLRKRLAEVALGKPVGPDIEKTTFEDMAVMIVNDYKANGRRSVARLEDALGHLREYFGDYRAVEITGDKVTSYVTYRQEQKAANSTINNELSALSRAFSLGIRSNRIATKPYIGKLALNNTRKGFFEWKQFFAVLKNLPEDLQPAIETAYITGWRIHDEIFTRQKHHADVNGRGWLRLDPGETKNGEGRNFPFTARLREIIAQQLERTKALEKATGRIIPWLFHRDGKQIKHFRRSWISACVEAGLGMCITAPNGKIVKKVAHRVPHDFRRTAVRNLERAGVPRSAAMKMVGHKTEAIYRRYAIAEEKMLGEAAAKLDQFHALERQPGKTSK